MEQVINQEKTVKTDNISKESSDTNKEIINISNNLIVKDKKEKEDLQKEKQHLQEQLQLQERMIQQLQQKQIQLQEFQQLEYQQQQQQQQQQLQQQHLQQQQHHLQQLQHQQLQLNLHDNNDLSLNSINTINMISEDGINVSHDVDEEIEEKDGKKPVRRGRRKIKIEFIKDKSRRHITFSKRKGGIMKKAYELTTLTGTQALLLVASETGHVYTFATPKLQPLITKPEGKNLIQSCLNAPDNVEQEEEEVVKTEEINEISDLRNIQMSQLQNQMNIPINRNIQFNQFSPIASSHQYPNINSQNRFNQNIQ